MKNELLIKNLKVSAYEKEILSNVSLNVRQGEVHAIMGPNGTGKSTLASAIMGSPRFTVEAGEVLLNGENILEMEVDERARKGIFLAMQNPSEVSGITNSNFIKTAVNSVRETPMGTMDFLKELDKNVKLLKIRPDLPHRYLNDGFSGGEKKRNEILQMLMLKPKFAILDEVDSGLDMDALKIVGNAVNKARENGMGVIIITHYQRILDYIKPDFVHILQNGIIAKTGGIELVKQIEESGYNF